MSPGVDCQNVTYINEAGQRGGHLGYMSGRLSSRSAPLCVTSSVKTPLCLAQPAKMAPAAGGGTVTGTAWWDNPILDSHINVYYTATCRGQNTKASLNSSTLLGCPQYIIIEPFIKYCRCAGNIDGAKVSLSHSLTGLEANSRFMTDNYFYY